MIFDTLKSSTEETWLTKTMNDFYREVEMKKDLLIAEKLTEKGFGYLIDGMAKRKFPKICCIVQQEWSYYYADNDTDEGCFIVAIRDIVVKNDNPIDRGFTTTLEFQWQDTLPIKEYVKK